MRNYSPISFYDDTYTEQPLQDQSYYDSGCLSPDSYQSSAQNSLVYPSSPSVLMRGLTLETSENDARNCKSSFSFNKFQSSNEYDNFTLRVPNAHNESFSNLHNESFEYSPNDLLNVSSESLDFGDDYCDTSLRQLTPDDLALLDDDFDGMPTINSNLLTPDWDLLGREDLSGTADMAAAGSMSQQERGSRTSTETRRQLRHNMHRGKFH